MGLIPQAGILRTPELLVLDYPLGMTKGFRVHRIGSLKYLVKDTIVGNEIERAMLNSPFN